MTTAQELINDAADLAGVLSEGQTLEAYPNKRYLRALNRMLSSWKDQGVDFDLSELLAGSTVYVDDSEEDAIVYGLAVKIYEMEGRSINPAIYQTAQRLFDTLVAKYLDPKDLKVPLSLKRNLTYDITHG